VRLVESKSFYKSKTFWFNLLAVIVLVANQFGFQEFEPNTQLTGFFIALMPIVNIALRFFTKQPLKVK